jgi:hypothetical protein
MLTVEVRTVEADAHLRTCSRPEPVDLPPASDRTQSTEFSLHSNNLDIYFRYFFYVLT